MAFDPTLPIENTELDAAQMRSQLNGLADLINTNSAGSVNSVGLLDSSSALADVIDKVNEMLTQMKR